MSIEIEEHMYYPSMTRAVADTAAITSRLLARKTTTAMRRSRHLVNEELFNSGLRTQDVASLAVSVAVATSAGLVLDMYGTHMTDEITNALRTFPQLPKPAEALSGLMHSMRDMMWPSSSHVPRG